MKIKEGFWMRQVGGTYVAVPLTGQARALSRIVNLNGSGALLFDLLQKGTDRDEMVRALLDGYDATRQEAEAAVDGFIGQLAEGDLLEA